MLTGLRKHVGQRRHAWAGNVIYKEGYACKQADGFLAEPVVMMQMAQELGIVAAVCRHHACVRARVLGCLGVCAVSFKVTACVSMGGVERDLVPAVTKAIEGRSGVRPQL